MVIILYLNICGLNFVKDSHGKTLKVVTIMEFRSLIICK